MPRLLFALTCLSLAGTAAARLPDIPAPHSNVDEVLVEFTAPSKALGVVERAGLTLKRTRLEGRLGVVAVPAFMTATQAADTFAAMPGVARAEPNLVRYRLQTTPNDEFFDDLWGLHNTGQANSVPGGPPGVPGGDINALAAWDPTGDGSFPRTGTGDTIIAVIDDAFDTSRADLAANFIPGRDLADDDDDVTPDNPGLQPHGTLVSAPIGAGGNNSTTVAGSVWNVQLLPLKVSSVDPDGESAPLRLDAILAAYQEAIDAGAHIINASYGSAGPSSMERDMIETLGENNILLVTSAGNSDANLDKSTLAYPANYALDNILTVAATNRQDNIASFSVYGPSRVEVAAPGLQILTLLPGTDLEIVSGTSFAAPYAAGVAALVRDHAGARSVDELIARIVGSGGAVDGANPDRMTRGGRIDAAKAIDAAPGPVIVLREVRFDDGASGNGRPDPGESLDLVVTLENLWQAADDVTIDASLSDSSDLEIETPRQSLATFPGVDSRPQHLQELRFPVTVADTANLHSRIELRLEIATTGGYAATRYSLLEYAPLQPGATANAAFGASGEALYDEFHAWHITLDNPVENLTISTSTPGGEDIDLLVRRSLPPEYQITVGTAPENDPTFVADPQTRVSGNANGEERIDISNAPAGTYHIVVVNFEQSTQRTDYTLRAATTSTGGGGGRTSLGLILAFGCATAMRRRALRRR